MYAPIFICLAYVSSIAGILEAKDILIPQHFVGFMLGFAYFCMLQLPLSFVGYDSRPSGWYGFFRPVYITFPLAIVYDLASFGLQAMPFVIHLFGTFAFVATMTFAIYKGHVMNAYFKVSQTS